MDLGSFLDLGICFAAGGGLALAASVAVRTFPDPQILLVHGLLSIVVLLGYRGVLHRLSSESADAEPPTDLPRNGHHRAQPAAPTTRLGDLVPRAPLDVDRSALDNLLSGQTVLVTGAGGSIGSELTEQLLTYSPARLVLVDVNEQNLYQLETDLRSRSVDASLSFCLADVRDETRMDGVLAREQPGIVFHTAAYKHVHLMERHPAEAFHNNTLATAGLLRLAERHTVDQFVFVSTDKAVAPQGVLGATKQWAEWYVRTAAPSLQARTVRFGNVFGSEGSVVPLFEEKLAAGEPLPVTHPEMERYFMTGEEACQLLLQTLLFETHPTYILEMGDPVQIQWLAEQMVQRWYPEATPSEMIQYVGRRPGEKLSEQLVSSDESVYQTDHPSILGLEAPVPHSRDTLDTYFQHLESLHDPAAPESADELARLLLRAQPTTSPSVA
jgi:FlaA1/EpsC-like NDP-sugar epimerase